MTSSNLSYRCYILPIVAAIVYLFFSLPIIVEIFNDWIPDYYYCAVVKSLLLLMILFLTCRVLDILWVDYCHDEQCTTSLNNICMNLKINEAKDTTTEATSSTQDVDLIK